MNHILERHFLELTLIEAEKALNLNTYPVGAVIVDKDNRTISHGRNQVYPNKDATAHAEIAAIRSAGEVILEAKARKKKLTLYSSLEPCPMCTGAILFAHISKVVWILNDDLGFGGYRKLRDSQLFDERFERIEVIQEPFKDLKERQMQLMESWKDNPNNIQNLRRKVK